MTDFEIYLSHAHIHTKKWTANIYENFPGNIFGIQDGNASILNSDLNIRIE